MNKHWEKATEEQVECADEYGFWAVEPELSDDCDGCALVETDCIHNEPCMWEYNQPSIIFKSKETKMSKKKVKIIQIIPDPEGDGVLGLGSDGVVYEFTGRVWKVCFPAKFEDEESEGGDE